MHQRRLRHRRQAFLLGHLNRLAAAAGDAIEVRRQRGKRGHRAALEIRLMAEELQRRQLREWRRARSGDRHARRMRGVKLIGAVMRATAALAERRDGGDDQPPMLIAQRCAIHRDRVSFGRRNVVDQEVGAHEQIVEAAAVRSVMQIQRHAALVGVEVQKQAAEIRIVRVIEKRAAPAGDVALPRLDLDYVGAQQRERLGGKRRGHPLRRVRSPGFRPAPASASLAQSSPASVRLLPQPPSPVARQRLASIRLPASGLRQGQ